MKKFTIAILLIAATLMISVPVKVQADTGWKQVDGAWYYYISDTTYANSGKYNIGSRAYFFDEYGRMQTGWCHDPYIDFWYYAESSGALVTGWKQISGKWYYFDLNNYYMYYNNRYEINGKKYYFGGYGMPGGLGAMQTGWIKEEYDYDGNHYVNWYYASEGGVLQKGWQKIGGKWYYFHLNTCAMYRNWYYEINGKTYYFLDSGAMGTGWCKCVSSSDYVIWFYADSNGILQKGWKKIGGKWYYFDEDYYSMYSGGQRYIGGKCYFFEDSGAMKTGWCKYTYVDTDSGKTYVYWYYANDNGELVSGWKKINGKWYYFYPGDYRLNNNTFCSVDGKVYYFDTSGAMKTGWIKHTSEDSYGNAYTKWFYAYSDGALVTGWHKINGAWYYFGSGYDMYTYTRSKIGDSYYFFTESGAMGIGWCKFGTIWYYADNDGKLITGWKTINGVTYYFDPAGNYMYTGIHIIGDKSYIFDSSGALVS